MAPISQNHGRKDFMVLRFSGSHRDEATAAFVSTKYNRTEPRYKPILYILLLLRCWEELNNCGAMNGPMPGGRF